MEPQSTNTDQKSHPLDGILSQYINYLVKEEYCISMVALHACMLMLMATNWINARFSNNFNKYWPISIICCTGNL